MSLLSSENLGCWAPPPIRVTERQRFSFQGTAIAYVSSCCRVIKRQSLSPHSNDRKGRPFEFCIAQNHWAGAKFWHETLGCQFTNAPLGFSFHAHT